jgi:hypothetical protein
MVMLESLDKPKLVFLRLLSLWLEILATNGCCRGVLAPTRALEVVGGGASARGQWSRCSRHQRLPHVLNREVEDHDSTAHKEGNLVVGEHDGLREL